MDGDDFLRCSSESAHFYINVVRICNCFLTSCKVCSWLSVILDKVAIFSEFWEFDLVSIMMPNSRSLLWYQMLRLLFVRMWKEKKKVVTSRGPGLHRGREREREKIREKCLKVFLLLLNYLLINTNQLIISIHPLYTRVHCCYAITIYYSFTIQYNTSISVRFLTVCPLSTPIFGYLSHWPFNAFEKEKHRCSSWFMWKPSSRGKCEPCFHAHWGQSSEEVRQPDSRDLVATIKDLQHS